MKLETLKWNFEKIQKDIDANKKENQQIELIAVTKYVDSETIRKLYKLGLRKFGENRVDDMLKKQQELEEINDEIEWHFIGPLQRRPVRKMIHHISFLHSLDRMSLIKEVDKRAEKIIHSTLQVNVSGEEQKGGFQPEEVLSVVESIGEYSNIQIDGLMTMAPHEASETQLHHYFSLLKELQQEIIEMNLPYAPCLELSMGMSQDYPIAIQEGATMIRIGKNLYEE